ncbi:MAG: peptidyl-prolyl cis-trans isomerase [Reinekea sp.]|nr:peptidyl-prolyl cis-trans isomerase [Reinekea sp.]
MTKRKSPWLVLPLFALLVTGCDRKENTPEIPVETAIEPAWAVVNGSNLTEAELDYAVDRFFGGQFVDARAVQKIRESLIASRALAQNAESTLDEDILSEIEIAVQAYREERLIAAYIENTTSPEPVTAQMVEAYYQSHLDEFGAATIKRLVVLEANVGSAKRSQIEVSQALAKLGQSENWESLVLPDYVRTYQLNSAASMPVKMKAVLQDINVGGKSAQIVDGEKIYLFRVVAEDQVPPKPLSEVSAGIRQRLAATQLSKTVKALSERVVSESDIIKNY